jgi:hypothetical protein
MMIKEAIDRILELAPVKFSIHSIGGREYSGTPLTGVRPPMCDSLKFHTLTGLADWVRHDKEDTPCLLRIIDEETVLAEGQMDPGWRQREVLARSDIFQYREFTFGNYMSIEDFIIQIQSKFVPTESTTALINAVSKISGDLVVTAEDDGAAQTVTVKDAIGRLADSKMNPIVELRPYRTFREVLQPKSAFLLRFKKFGEGLPQIALFEADGGAWRNEAVQSIKAYLEATSLGVEIIA